MCNSKCDNPYRLGHAKGQGYTEEPPLKRGHCFNWEAAPNAIHITSYVFNHNLP